MQVVMDIDDNIKDEFYKVVSNFKDKIKILNSNELTSMDRAYLDFLEQKNSSKTKASSAKELIKDIEDELHS
jgi:predicted ABC-type exoprotein transport system permease subunit